MKPIIAYLYPTPEQLAETKKKLFDQLFDHFGDISLRDCDPVDLDLDLAQRNADRDLVHRAAYERGGFMWITHSGEVLQPCDMATPHLFYSLRMIFNHSVPPVFRILGPGEEMRRYPDVPHWTAEYRREAIAQLSAELDSRLDIFEFDHPELAQQYADIKQNAAVILALGL